MGYGEDSEITDARASIWMSSDDWFTFIDYDGESLKVRRKAYKDDGYDEHYIAVTYEGQGPVVMEVDEARRFIKQFTQMLDEIEGNDA
jgi:hypothetical protein